MTRLLFIPARNHRFYYSAFLLSFVTLAWMLFGVYLQTTGKATSCPDWPRCFGAWWVPHITYHADAVRLVVWYRYVFAAIAAGIVLLTLAALRLSEELSIQPLGVCLLLIAFVLGDIHVSLKTAADSTPALLFFQHRLLALSMVAVLWWLCRITRPQPTRLHHASNAYLKPWLWLSFWIACIITVSLFINMAAIPNCTHLAVCSESLQALLPAVFFTLPPKLHILFAQHTLDLFTTISLCYLAMISLFLLRNQHYQSMAFLLFVLLIAKFSLITAPLYQTFITVLLLLTVITLLIEVHRRPHQYWSR